MALTVAMRVQKRRDAMRSAGLRPIQIWVPDTRQPHFAAECKRQSALLANDVQEAEVLAWMETVSDTDDWQ